MFIIITSITFNHSDSESKGVKDDVTQKNGDVEALKLQSWAFSAGKMNIYSSQKLFTFLHKMTSVTSKTLGLRRELGMDQYL